MGLKTERTVGKWEMHIDEVILKFYFINLIHLFLIISTLPTPTYSFENFSQNYFAIFLRRIIYLLFLCSQTHIQNLLQEVTLKNQPLERRKKYSGHHKCLVYIWAFLPSCSTYSSLGTDHWQLINSTAATLHLRYEHR